MSNFNYDNNQLLRLMNNELSEEELSQLRADENFQKYKAILDEVDSWSLPELDIETSYERLQSKKNPTKVISISWYQTNIFKVAATVLILASAMVLFFVSGSVVKHETQLAQTENIILPDNSKVFLGPASQLTYDEDKWAKVRQIDLKGTAYFDVEKGQPFKVSFGLGSLEVLGTSFEIKSFNNFASVMCYDGTVRVKVGDKSASLSKGQGLRINDKQEVETFDFPNVNWSASVIRFQSAPLSTVFESLSSQFGIEIKTGNIDLTRTFSGSYSTKDLDTALKMICDPMNINYERSKNSVTLQ